MANDLSLRDQLQASFDELSADPGGEPAAPEAQGVVAGAEAGPAPGPATEAKAETGDRPRGPDGKFAPKTDNAPAEGSAPAAAAPPAETPQPETAKPAGQEPQTPEAIRVPPSLPAALKAKFGTLDPDVQQAFVALEGSVQKAKAEWEGKGQRLNRFDEIIGPRLPRWQMAGIDEFQGVQMLLAAQDILDRDPVQGLVQVARSYGVTPAHLAQAFGLTQTSAPQPGSEGQPAPTQNPDFQAALQAAVAPLVNEVQTLKHGFTQSQQAAETAQLQQIADQIVAFSQKSENLYYADVESTLLETIRQERARGVPITPEVIQNAYDAATWANPTIRPLLLNATAEAKVQESARAAAEAKRQAEEAARAKAQQAQAASGSVTGSPAPGSAPPSGPRASLREELRASMQAAQGA